MAGAPPPSEGSFPNYEKELDRCVMFLKEFSVTVSERFFDENSGETVRNRLSYKYMEAIDDVVKSKATNIEISLDDVVLYNDPQLADEITANAMRYVSLFSTAVDKIINERRINPTNQTLSEDQDVADVILNYRFQQIKQAQLQNQELQPASSAPTDAELQQKLRDMLPPALLRRFEIKIRPRESTEMGAVSLRNVKSTDLGKLVSVRAIVLRASDVKPIIQVAAYTCDACGYEIYQEVNSRTFTPVPRCVSEQCLQNQTTGRVSLITRGCRFMKYQELKIQELPEQVPIGSIPRTMTVIARGSSTRTMKPGDNVIISGVFLPTPYTGFQAIRAGLTADTYLEAQSLVPIKRQDSSLSADTEAHIRSLLADPRMYTRLAESIAPEIYGHSDVKKSLLLQLVGGVSRQEADGMRTRGDMHMCLMGDPGVAKSQLLKYISRLSSRCVYTTGKGSTGVGLTAAVVRDPITQELSLEGGALVLADTGICCIDEFDKMGESDRTAIHEVMEQQTISIAKAGITTMLNARTSILAAANPKFGRYNRAADKNPHKALLKNINLPAALLSRFDIIFLLLDEVDSVNDRSLAEHVTYVHQNDTHPPLKFTPVDPAIIRQYVAVAKHIQCHVPPEITDYIVEAYVDIREQDAKNSAKSGDRGTVTARHLLSILRLSEALARLHLRIDVTTADVDEAIRLVQASKASVLESIEDREGSIKYVATNERIWQLVRQTAKGSKSISLDDLKPILRQNGFTDIQFDNFIKEYQDLNIIMVNPSFTRIDFITNY